MNIKFKANFILFSFWDFQGVWGFITGGLTWFAIPFSLATTMGLAYLGMSSAQGAPLLSEKDISAGIDNYNKKDWYLTIVAYSDVISIAHCL